MEIVDKSRKIRAKEPQVAKQINSLSSKWVIICNQNRKVKRKKVKKEMHKLQIISRRTSLSSLEVLSKTKENRAKTTSHKVPEQEDRIRSTTAKELVKKAIGISETV